MSKQENEYAREKSSSGKGAATVVPYTLTKNRAGSIQFGAHGNILYGTPLIWVLHTLTKEIESQFFNRCF